LPFSVDSVHPRNTPARQHDLAPPTRNGHAGACAIGGGPSISIETAALHRNGLFIAPAPSHARIGNQGGLQMTYASPWHHLARISVTAFLTAVVTPTVKVADSAMPVVTTAQFVVLSRRVRQAVLR
jgi:hypothetical protein